MQNINELNRLNEELGKLLKSNTDDIKTLQNIKNISAEINRISVELFENKLFN